MNNACLIKQGETMQIDTDKILAEDVSERIKKIEKRYLQCDEHSGIDNTDIQNIQNLLKIILPADFIQIAQFFSGGYFGGISNHSFNKINGCDNIIDETIRLRETIRLPNEYIVLAEPPESLIVFNTIKEPAIIWCDAIESDKIATSTFITPPETWNHYYDFFLELIENEEEDL
jgi:hypothetical protein